MSAFAGTLNQSAMRHGGSFWAILASAWVGVLMAGAVYTLAPPRLAAESTPPVSFLAANEFEAVSFIEDGANAATAPSEPPARNDEQAAQLFGMETEPVAAGELPEKWHRVEAAMVHDFAVIAQCHANFECKLKDARLVERYNFFIFEVVKAHVARRPVHPQTLHYTGDGVFMVSGKIVSRRNRFKPEML